MSDAQPKSNLYSTLFDQLLDEIQLKDALIGEESCINREFVNTISQNVSCRNTQHN